MRTYAVVRSKRERDHWLWLAERQRVTRRHDRDRETLGSRALSALSAEHACWGDPGELAGLYAGRIDGNVSI